MFRLENFMGRKILTSSLYEDEDVSAFFTTRDLPLKAGEREDLIEEVEDNKRLVCDRLNIPSENLVIPVQTHSDNVEIVTLQRRQDEWRRGGVEEKIHSSTHLCILPSFENTDALVTNQRGVALALNFADCVPLLFYDPVKKVVAGAHAGWRGTVAKIGPKTVEKMVENFKSNPADIIALIGPAIGKCCFEVQEDVKEKILSSIDRIKYLETSSQVCTNNNIDLKLVNKEQLLAIGIKKIDVCEYCTSCQNELFFSYRKEKGKTARHSAVIMIRVKSER